VPVIFQELATNGVSKILGVLFHRILAGTGLLYGPLRRFHAVRKVHDARPFKALGVNFVEPRLPHLSNFSLPRVTPEELRYLRAK
ncbi:hypothetical protein ABZ372_33605, partial [Streptomyces sp. NPDC005921]